MSLVEFINKGFEAGSISAIDVTLSLVVAFICSLYILYVYRKTFNGVVYNRSLVLSLVMVSLVTAMIIRTINSNLSLTLGMVGALSIVRFRTAIKEPLDTAYMFWGITAGIMSGAGLYLVAMVGTLVLGALFYAIYSYHAKAKSQYLLVITYKNTCEKDLDEKLKNIKKTLKSKSTVSGDTLEATYEVEVSDGSIINELLHTKGVKNASLITYQNEIGL